MSLRVGYVNVNGLSSESWAAASSLLDGTLDILFLAETWYVDAKVYGRDRRMVASTVKREGYRTGRLSGGLALLATRETRSRLRSVAVVSDWVITFAIGRDVVSGIYLPPSMGSGEFISTLASVASSTVVIGDVNARFPACPFQQGQPGPPDRIKALSDFHRLVHVLPTQAPTRFNGILLQQQLTVDHCFVDSKTNACLRLLDNTALGMCTDHRYTLHLTLHASTPKPSTSPDLPRYRVGRLREEKVRVEVARYFDDITAEEPAGKHFQDVDELNARLTDLCRHVAKCVLGPASSESVAGVRRPKVEDPRGSGPMEETVRLFKEAARGSRENDVILPTLAARSRGETAMDEISAMLKRRYSEPGGGGGYQSPHPKPEAFVVDGFERGEIADEIIAQDSSKTCGMDGLHTRFLKALLGSPTFLDMLHRLYGRCLASGRTPRVWNDTVIYMLVKDMDKIRDASNVRPITIICMFRKVFERLLLRRFDGAGWANLHPTQAGFGSRNSTCMCAGVVHHLLATKICRTAVFLDFRAAFDVVGHERLAAVLQKRGCPPYLQALVVSLMFRETRSRVLVNGGASAWFERTRGVLQGSPLSPCLWNLFVDGLLEMLNEGSTRYPVALFFADDGVLVTDDRTDTQMLLDIVYGWGQSNGIELNVAKCGHLTSLPNPKALTIGEETIAPVESYDYLGFPMTARGIDFRSHVEGRMTAAVGRSRWLSRFSDDWGPAHRLRVYHRYLAPMFEYGAPLVYAWALESKETLQQFETSASGFKSLMAWVARSEDGRYMLTANLCGLNSLLTRFELLHTFYQLILDGMESTNPLRKILDEPRQLSYRPDFKYRLGHSARYNSFKKEMKEERFDKSSLRTRSKRWRASALASDSHEIHLTALIPAEARRVKGLFLADISLSVPMPAQELLFQYRRANFCWGRMCVCDPRKAFDRGHETCRALPQPVRLTRKQRWRKAMMGVGLGLGGRKFTDLDFLLNVGRLDDATTVLEAVKETLSQVFASRKGT